LYLQRPIHAPEDEHYYTELALRLIDATEISERAALAARLASYQSAPKPVLERLARDVIEVAGPILEHSPCPAHLEAAAEPRARSRSSRRAKRSPRRRATLAPALVPRLPRPAPAALRNPCEPLALSMSPRLASCRSCSTRQKRPSAD